MKRALSILSLLFLFPAPEFSIPAHSQHTTCVEIESRQYSSPSDSDILWIENAGENTNEEHCSNPAISTEPVKAPVATPCESWLITVAQNVGFHTSLDQIFLRGPPQSA